MPPRRRQSVLFVTLTEKVTPRSAAAAAAAAKRQKPLAGRGFSSSVTAARTRGRSPAGAVTGRDARALSSRARSGGRSGSFMASLLEGGSQLLEGVAIPAG